MEVTTSERYASGGELGEPPWQNLVRAFYEQVERLGDDVAIRTEDDSYTISWNDLRERVHRIAGGLAKLGVKKGDTVALMLNNRPEFIPCDLAAVSLGGVPFSIYQTSSPEQIEYVVSDAGSKVAIVETMFLEQFERCPREPAGPRARDRRRRGRRGPHARRSRADGSGLRSGRDRRRDPARRPADADLHLGDDRSAEGRAADPPEPDDPDEGGRGDRQLPRSRRQGDLVAARCAHRRARRPLLPAVHPRRLGDDLPGPAQDRRLARGGPADLVLRGAANLREAQGGNRGELRQASRRAARGGPEGRRGRDPEGPPGAGRGGGPGGARGRGRPGRGADVLAASLQARLRRAGRDQRGRRARPRSRCSSSSTRSESRSASSGECPRPAASSPATRPRR